jgi:hypothetical protein
MASFLEDLEVAGQIIGVVTEFEQGQPATASPTIGGKKVNVSVVELPQGEVPPYVELSGSIWQQAWMAFTLAEGYLAGTPLSLAISVDNKVYGLTISEPVT